MAAGALDWGYGAGRGDGSRALLVCVACSILLHAAIVFLVPAARPGSAASSIILRARLLTRSGEPEAAAPAQPPVTEAQPQPPEPPKPQRPPEPPSAKVAAPRPPAPVAVPTARAPLSVAPKVAPSLPALPPPPAAPQSSAPQAAPPQAAAPATPGPVASLAPAAPRPAPGTDNSGGSDSTRAPSDAEAATIGQFRESIIMATKHYKRYPAQAMEKGWEGRVEIRLIIDANGRTQSFVVKLSSNFPLLDDTALDMVKKGRPLVPVPATLRGREFTVDVPIVFNLHEG